MQTCKTKLIVKRRCIVFDVFEVMREVGFFEELVEQFDHFFWAAY